MFYHEYNLSRKVRRRKILIACVCAGFLLFVLLILNSDYSPDLYFISFGEREDVSCHYVREGDALPTLNQRFFPSSNSIFFHETSCKGRLNSRQACSVESAARAHPNWEIHVLFSAPVNKLSLADVNIELLKMLRNVYFSRVHILDYAKDTPLEDLISGGALNRTKWPVSHTSDILRFLTLYKWGGTYLDLDMIVVKPLDGLKKSWVARENHAVIGSAALSLYRDRIGTFVADTAVRMLAKSFRGDVWGHNGPELITKVLKQICSTSDVAAMNAHDCLGLEVYSPELIYGMSPDNPEVFFEPGTLELKDNTYMYHIWNHQTKDMKIPKDSPYVKLAKQFCPLVYETYRGRFGLI